MPLLFRHGPSVAPGTEPLLPPDVPDAGSAGGGHSAAAGGGDGTPAVAGPGAVAALAVWPLLAVVGVLPVLPLQTAIQQGVVSGRTDYQDELGWPALAAQVGRLAGGADVVVTINYGEAGALELFGRGLPPVASANVTFRYWRPPVAGRHAILVGFPEAKASGFCGGYTLLGRIEMPTANQERGLPIASCTLDSSLAAEWPQILQATGS